MPLPSGAQAVCAPIWLLITVRRGPRAEPLKDARVRYETCVPYVQIIAIVRRSGDSDGCLQASSGRVSALPCPGPGGGARYRPPPYGRSAWVVSQIWLVSLLSE